MIGLRFEDIRQKLNPSQPEMQSLRRKATKSQGADLSEITATIQLVFDRVAEVMNANNQKIEADLRDAGIKLKT